MTTHLWRNMNPEPIDYEARKGLQELQQRPAEVLQQPKLDKRQSAGQPQKDEQKQDETPLTRGEAQGLINSLVESIVKGFAQKGDVDRIARSFEIAKQELKRSVPTKKQIIDWATECVPPSLRGLDSDPTRKLGEWLKMVAGYPVGSDKVVCMPAPESFTVNGAQVLYCVVTLRESDEWGDVPSN